MVLASSNPKWGAQPIAEHVIDPALFRDRPCPLRRYFSDQLDCLAVRFRPQARVRGHCFLLRAAHRFEGQKPEGFNNNPVDCWTLHNEVQC
jgi:hypothetical protein